MLRRRTMWSSRRRGPAKSALPVRPIANALPPSPPGGRQRHPALRRPVLGLGVRRCPPASSRSAAASPGEAPRPPRVAPPGPPPPPPRLLALGLATQIPPDLTDRHERLCSGPDPDLVGAKSGGRHPFAIGPVLPPLDRSGPRLDTRRGPKRRKAGPRARLPLLQAAGRLTTEAWPKPPRAGAAWRGDQSRVARRPFVPCDRERRAGLRRQAVTT